MAQTNDNMKTYERTSKVAYLVTCAAILLLEAGVVVLLSALFGADLVKLTAGTLVILWTAVRMVRRRNLVLLPRAAEPIKAGQLVYFTDDTHKSVRLANAADFNFPSGVGLAVSDASKDEPVKVVQRGVITGLKPPDSSIYYHN